MSFHTGGNCADNDINLGIEGSGFKGCMTASVWIRGVFVSVQQDGPSVEEVCCDHVVRLLAVSRRS